MLILNKNNRIEQKGKMEQNKNLTIINEKTKKIIYK